MTPSQNRPRPRGLMRGSIQFIIAQALLFVLLKMEEQMTKLTALKVAKAKPGRYGDGHGLCLQVTDAGVKSWLLRYERNGRERWMGLGPLHTVSLSEARDRARRARLQLLDGIDPLEARKTERSTQALAAARALTFE